MSDPTPATYGYPVVAEPPVLRPGPDGKSVGVVQAICNVMTELPSIGKDDKSPEGYAYRGIEAITRHVQTLFAKHGLVPVPRAEIVKVVPSPAMKDGWQDVVMRVEWHVLHTDGSSVVAITNGVGRDRSDKYSNKAQTQAFKYLLVPLLSIADGKDDPDAHSDKGGRDEGLNRRGAKAALVAKATELGADKDTAMRLAANTWRMARADEIDAYGDAAMALLYGVLASLAEDFGVDETGAPAPAEPGPDAGEGEEPAASPSPGDHEAVTQAFSDAVDARQPKLTDGAA